MAQKLLGTCEEALDFLTLPTTKRTAWTDVIALIEACYSVRGLTSLDEIAGTERELRVSQILDAIEFTYPIPDAYFGDWRDWLNAFLSDNPEIELVLLEDAVDSHARKTTTN